MVQAGQGESRELPEYIVLRIVDAHVHYRAKVEADDEEEAAQLASDNEQDYDWEEDDTVTFEAREFVSVGRWGTELD